MILPLALAAVGAFPCMAQEPLHETLYVEGEYVPAVVRQDKIHLLPQKKSFELPAVDLRTSTGLLTGDYGTTFAPLPAPVWQGELAGYPWRGYLDAAVGSYLNATVSAGYRVAHTGRTQADVWLQHNSTSLFHPRMSLRTPGWKRYRYDEALGATLRQSLGNAGNLAAALTYRIGFFDYYGITFDKPEDYRPEIPVPGEAPSQTLNDVSLRLAWRSVRKGAWRWGLRAEGSYFGYARNYTVHDYEFERWKGQRELQASIGGSGAVTLSEGHDVAVGADFTALGYNKAVSDGRSRSLQTVRLNPAYIFTSGRFSSRLGVVADFTWGAGKSLGPAIADLDYSVIHAAPDVRLDYDGGIWSASLGATGGQRLQTLRSGYELDYYQKPLLDYVQPSFVPLEATLRLQYGGNGTFSAGIDVTYMSLRHLFLGGWYMNELSAYSSQAGKFDPLYTNLSGCSIGADARWRPFAMLELRGRATYQPQNDRGTGFFNGYDRPRWTVDAEAEIKPVAPLSVSLGYRYRGVRNIYSGYGDNRTEGIRLPDICNLRLGARYRIIRNLSVYATADNLLGKRMTLLPNQRGEGFNFLVGADVLF